MAEILTAKNPFNGDLEIQGCPRCFAIDQFTWLCDVPGCTKYGGMLFKLDGVQRHTCWNHSELLKQLTATKPAP